jgi:hypothetical protein
MPAYRCTARKTDWGARVFNPERIREELPKITNAIKTYASASRSEPIFVAKSISETFHAIVEEREAVKARRASNAT